MNQIEKNTVSSKNQLTKSQFISYLYPKANGRKILFAGNSITRHAPKADIGWHFDHGMAASTPEQDYVHLVTEALRQKEDVSACIAQVAVWESDWKNGKNHYADYQAAQDFDPDILIIRFIENTRVQPEDAEQFQKELEDFIDFLNPNPKTQVIMTTSFWKHPADPIYRTVAEKRGYTLIEFGDLGETDSMKAIGLYEHDGVANHPGDLGMETIAKRILEAIK